MKTVTCFCLGLFIIGKLTSQNRYDNNWVFARVDQGVLLNFNSDSLHVQYIPQLELRTVEAHMSMSDAEGNLLFYSNNCSISNAAHQVMENGEGLNPGLIQTYWCSVNPYANPHNQSILSLPSPENSNIYYVFHIDLELFNFGGPGGSDYAPMNLYKSLINIQEENGLGKVIEKNIPILEDSLAWNNLQATKHANGRDWWIICPEYKSNCYYKILLDPNGVTVAGKQCAGYSWEGYGATGGAYFTPDGARYVRSNADNGLNIFDFDRCTGELSNPVHISLSPDTNRISSMAISANSRFVYAIFLDKIFQFDLYADDIPTSKTLVALYDGYQSAGNPTDFYHAKLAPDGKIYICTFGPTYYLHTINNPDSVGIACQVLQHNVLLPYTHYAAMPNSPNYKLGSLPGPCDTIAVSANEILLEDGVIKIFPNPSSHIINIISERENTQINEVRLYDLSGRLALKKDGNNALIQLNNKELQLPQGIYIVVVFDSLGRRHINKLVIEIN
ncbi:MAG: T9SS type A sorting domain-containing protein [Saprospiraceae bacterium]|nr:T9SS type A sorting domain-containing protein [Saprospiraceae bacterium]